MEERHVDTVFSTYVGGRQTVKKIRFLTPHFEATLEGQ